VPLFFFQALQETVIPLCWMPPSGPTPGALRRSNRRKLAGSPSDLAGPNGWMELIPNSIVAGALAVAQRANAP